MKSDSEIVGEVLDGRQSAYAELVGRYERPVRAVGLQILGDPHHAEDISQETFLTAYEKLATLRNPSAFGAWILRIARRKANRLSIRMERFDPLEEGNTNLEAGLDGRLNEQMRWLLNVMGQLPEHEKQVVMLKHFNDYTIQEIARMTGKPVGTVTKQLSRAYMRLRKMLKGVQE